VYHEVIASAMEYERNRGFTRFFIWSCPPAAGDDYIFYVHPKTQRFVFFISEDLDSSQSVLVYLEADMSSASCLVHFVLARDLPDYICYLRAHSKTQRFVFVL
jgi:hypothetical protein